MLVSPATMDSQGGIWTYGGEVVDVGHAEVDQLRGQLLRDDLNGL
jgi:hypothetical protein